MQIDIQKIANDHIKGLEEKGTIEKTIQDSIEKSVLSAITSALEGYKIRREIEEKVEKQVSSIVSEIGFTAYNGFIAEKIKQITEGVMREDVAKKIQKTFDEMLIVKRDSIKLSEICDAYRDWICDDVEESEQYDLEQFYVSVKENEQYGWLNFVFAKEKPTSYDKSDSISFTIHKNHKNKNIGKMGAVYIDGHGIDKTLN